MIWTLIAFAITFFVLKQVRVRPDPAHDRRAARANPARGRGGGQGTRGGARAARAAPGADRARRRARRRRSSRTRARSADAQVARVKEEVEADRQRRLEETRRQIEAETQALPRTDPLRDRRPHARGDRPRDREGPRRRGPAPAHRRGDLRARLLRPRGGRLGRMAVAQRMYARALFEAAQEEEGSTGSRRDVGRARRRARAGARAAAFLRNPQVEPAGKADGAGAARDGRRRARPQLRPPRWRRRAGRARSSEIARELDALVARAQNRLAVELETAHELSDAEAKSIVDTIEKASGRTVEATRSVDPGLIGGIVLQVGSFRVDGSVRGRLERLRPRTRPTAT